MGLRLYTENAIAEMESQLYGLTPEEADMVEDMIPEIASENLPIYYSDMLDCVSDDIGLFITRSDMSPPDATPDRLIMDNIEDHIRQKLYERLQEWIDEYEYPED